MAANSKIEWTHHTFNPWRGCTKVSAGCANCYAETMSKRNPKVLGIWGDGGTRVIASEAMWREPFKWNAAAQCNCGAAGSGGGECAFCAGGCDRPRVFCASLADVCEDRPELEVPRARLKRVIRDTPNLNWLLLTKRPENLNRFFFGDDWPDNVWAGTSVEDQKAADQRIPHLLKCPAAVRFLSCEPLLEAVNLRPQIGPHCFCNPVSMPTPCDEYHETGRCSHTPSRIQWVIVGGESGSGARAFDLEWARQILRQCRSAGVPCFVKQLGSVVTGIEPWPVKVPKKGGDMSKWPKDLRVRELPA